MSIQVELRKVLFQDGHVVHQSGERLSINESLVLPARSFVEVCQVLARFHELAEALKAEGGRLR